MSDDEKAKELVAETARACVAAVTKALHVDRVSGALGSLGISSVVVMINTHDGVFSAVAGCACAECGREIEAALAELLEHERRAGTGSSPDRGALH